ncbi:MAG: hypothetical protein WC323_00490 [Patescibacteria group bacterium]|jgi:predicted nucleotidyltransferase
MLVSTFASLREVTFDLNHELKRDFISDPNSNSNSELELAVKKTLVFFNIFDYPLTDWEIYKYLWVGDLNRKSFNYGEIKYVLNSAPDGIAHQDGFYFLSGGEELVLLRKERQIISRKKYKRALRVIKILSVLPFVKMIAVCNTLAYDNVRDDSDIDLFIVTAKDKIWTARFYSLALLKLLRLRPEKDNKKDKFCLNFFISEDNLNLQKLTIENDIYFAYWLKQLLPVYNDEIFKKLVEENKDIGQLINNNSPAGFFNKRKVRQGVIIQGLKSMLEVLNAWGWMEKLLKLIQLKIMPRNMIAKSEEGTGVVINDKVLKFHVDDRRGDIRNEWEKVTSNQ